MQLQESISMAMNSIKSNKLRSILTLLGIGVGVFSIIGVMTAMGVLQNSIESGINNSIASHTFSIQKYPAISFGPRNMQFRKRKDITLEQGIALQDKLSGKATVSLQKSVNMKIISFQKNKTNPNVEVAGVLPEGFSANNWNVDEGRGFDETDLRYSKNVAIVGQNVIKTIMPYASPVGQEIKIDGVPYTVIGTIKEIGSFIGSNQDNFVVIPLSTALEQFGKEKSIGVKVQASSREVYDEVIEIARMAFRAIRQVEPGADDDFEIVSNDSIVKQFNELTFMIKIGTLGIACIALLAAGIGIMNIMLVSVTERTKEIGIRKAIGATKNNILTQFLTESVVFSQFGGLIGIITGSLLGNVVSLLMNSPILYPWNMSVAILQTPFFSITPFGMNVIAILFCSFIGILFGLYPAWKAANLDPIESLRYE